MKWESMLPTPANLTLEEIHKRFATDEAARASLEEICWPHGGTYPECPMETKTGSWAIKPNKGKSIRAEFDHRYNTRKITEVNARLQRRCKSPQGSG